MLPRLWFVALILSVSSMIWSVPVMGQDGELCDVITVESALASDASTAETLVSTGLQMTVRNDFATAITLFSQALNLDPELFDAYLYRGCAYANNNEPDNAIVDLQTYGTLINDPTLLSDIETYVGRIMSGPRNCVAGSYYADESEARGIVNSFIELGATADDYNLRGLAYSCLGDYDLAIRDFSKALDLDKKDARFYVNRGDVYLFQADYENAIVEYQRAIQLNNQNDTAWNNMGFAMVELGYYDDALDAYNESIKLESTDSVTFSNRADLLVILERYEEAELDYTEAINVDPSAPNYNQRGLFYFDFNLYELARNDFQMAADIEHEAVYLYNVGYMYYLEFDYENAILYFNESLAVDSDYVVARSDRGLAYWKSGEYALCIADYTVLLSMDPTNGTAANNRGLCHDSLYQYDLAIDDFTRAIELDGVLVIELQNRGDTLRKAERYDESLDDLTTAIEMDETNPQSWNFRGITYDVMGDYDNALSDYTQAITLDPTFAIVYYNRAYTHYDLGNNAQSIEDFETYLELESDGFYREDVEGMLAELGAGGS